MHQWTRTPLLRLAVIAAAVWMIAIVPGCTEEVSGVYRTGKGDTIEFKDGRVFVTIWPAPAIEGEYELDGDRIILRFSGQSMVLTRKGNVLEGAPFGQRFVQGEPASNSATAAVEGPGSAAD